MKTRRIKIIILASLISLAVLVAAAIAFNPLDRQPSLSESELEAIARAWTEDNMDGAAGGELIEFIVANTTVNSPDLFRQYLKSRMDSGAAWTYGPFANAGGAPYEASATAVLRLEDIMPVTFPDEIKRRANPRRPSSRGTSETSSSSHSA